MLILWGTKLTLQSFYLSRLKQTYKTHRIIKIIICNIKDNISINIFRKRLR
nr:MAG TPA: hypothetical protein [Caudoviricetes sp.]